MRASLPRLLELFFFRATGCLPAGAGGLNQGAE